ncbi:MAG: hypothetical protein ACTSWN_11880 [Promethearchaeota archaeon]
MTIEIDDAGSGDPLLGTVIGFYRQETNELHFEWIPLEVYQEGTYYKELPQEEAAKAVMRGLLHMNIKEEEEVLICSGSIFDKAREALDKANIKHRPLKVEGFLQDAVEEEYIKAVERLGISSKHLRVAEDNKEKGYKKRYHILLNWAKKNSQEREKYVKNALNFWKYSKSQRRPIPGGWKKARKEFEEKLEGLLHEQANSLDWNKLKSILKHTFPKNTVWVETTVSLTSKNPNPHKNHRYTLKIQCYNSILNQVYFFIGKKFKETPRNAIWKSILLNDKKAPVNGIVFYVRKDEQYKENIQWLSFLRPKAKVMLGSHIRFVVKPF